MCVRCLSLLLGQASYCFLGPLRGCLGGGSRTSLKLVVGASFECHWDDTELSASGFLQVLGIWYERGKALIFVQSQDKCDTLFRDLLKVRTLW